METITAYWGYIGIVENKMEATYNGVYAQGVHVGILYILRVGGGAKKVPKEVLEVTLSSKYHKRTLNPMGGYQFLGSDLKSSFITKKTLGYDARV